MSRRYDWNKAGRRGLALATRILAGFLACIAVVLWAECLFLAVTRDWTLALAPLLPTAAAVLIRVGMWHVYGARPDYSAIAAMEREVLGGDVRARGGAGRLRPAAARPVHGHPACREPVVRAVRVSHSHRPAVLPEVLSHLPH